VEKIHDKKPVLQVFICTRNKDNGESCGAKGSAALRDELKKWAKEQKLTPDIKITASLCLGHCERGITACFQPTNEWYVNIQANEIDVLKEKILKDYRNIKA
jgi:predicted metal-binding protein